MAELKRIRDEKFAQLVAQGLSQSEAYRRVSGKTANADNHGDEYMVKRGMNERIAELRAESASKASVTREQLVESLAEMYRSAPGQAALDNPLCDSLISRGVRHAVFPMKATIANQLAKLCGWERPVEVKIEAGDKLAGLLDRVFGSGGEKDS